MTKNQGFTLIEVLVASVILFTSIAMVSMVFRGAFISSEKANNHITITGVLPSVLAIVRQNIRNQGNTNSKQLSGKDSTWNVNYQWQATLILHQSAPKKLDENTGKFAAPPPKYKLWQVQLSLEAKGITQSYQFKELSWSND